MEKSADTYASSEGFAHWNRIEVAPSYDVFISHHWNENDDKVSFKLYNTLLDRVVRPDKSAAQVFLDKFVMNENLQLSQNFGKALISSTLFVPILSTAALQTMINHNPREQDNVLIQWMLALECMQDPNRSKVRGIYPLMFGERNADGSVGDLFYEGALDRLPEIIPTASIEVVRRLLEENGVMVSFRLATLTVRCVVRDISIYMGLKGWEHPHEFTSTVTAYIVNRLEYSLQERRNNPSIISEERVPVRLELR